MPSLRRRWPLAVALLLLVAAGALFTLSAAYAWLHFHQSAYPQEYLLVRPYLYTALPLVNGFALVVMCGFGFYLRRQPKRPQSFPSLGNHSALLSKNDSLAISPAPHSLRQP